MFNLIEDRRTDLIAQAKRGQREKGDNKTRFQKRVRSRFSSSTREYNQINMNQLFKENILTVAIPIRGETDDYFVRIKFAGFLDTLRKRIKSQDNVFDLRSVIRALIDTFNSGDVYISCSCPDFFYRFGYWATVDDINSGEPQLIPSDETNPKNNLGPGCKHIMLVLSNTAWLIKVASVVNNYIKYFEKNRRKEYEKIIYPAIYGIKYVEPVIDEPEDTVDLETDTEIIDTANIAGVERGRFQKGNPYRFKSKAAVETTDENNDDSNQDQEVEDTDNE